MASSQLETETKHELDFGAALPELGDLAGVAEVGGERHVRLEAVYFDTVDLRLARAGVTVRRRSGGGDEGWHVKLPLGSGDRLEVNAPLGRAARTVPVRAARLVRGHARGADLVPVARVSTRRAVRLLLAADGAVLAEIADDRVDAEVLAAGRERRASRWRELEVELVEGDRSLLEAAGEALLAAGARPPAYGSKLARALRLEPGDDDVARARSPKDPVGQVVLGHLRGQVDELVRRDPQVRCDLDDSVHKMRVATRRLRSALATYRPLLDTDATEPLREELRWLGGVLGDVRDAEVMLARLIQSLDAEPRGAVVGPVRGRVTRELRGRIRSARREVLQTLDGDRYLALLDSLDTVLADPLAADDAGRTAGKVLPARVRKAWKRVRDRADAAAAAAGSADRDAALHEVRKAAKRARYAAESAEPALGAPAGRFASAMEDVQDVLGEHQDGVVARKLLLDLSKEAHAAGESTFTYGRLHAREEARAEAGLHAFDRTWPKASRPKLRRWLG